MLLMIDNYDSFTFNLVQYFAELGEEMKVVRNDEIRVSDIAAIKPDRICISPGPCSPTEAGISVATIQQYAGKIPILGVCLGHQAIGEAFGGKVIRAKKVMHGKTDEIHHTGEGVFHGLPERVRVTRYHSLAIEKTSFPDCLKITAETDDGEIMGVRHPFSDVAQAHNALRQRSAQSLRSCRAGSLTAPTPTPGAKPGPWGPERQAQRAAAVQRRPRHPSRLAPRLSLRHRLRAHP